MCGLVGFLGFSREDSLPPWQVLQAMTDAIVHRGPDSEGHWLDPAAQIALGHRRLSIVDLSPAGAQPMHSPSGRYVIAFNGEIYNHQDLREALGIAGVSDWRGHSDTETLIAGFDVWGIEETVRRCIGMFAIAVWDRGQRRLTLVRDRMGEKPLYYGWIGNGGNRTFVFGSEIKALQAHPAFDVKIDRAALARYMERMVVQGCDTIFSGLRKVPPGAIITLDEGAPEPRETLYWSINEAAENGLNNRFTGSQDEAVAELESILSDAVAQQMVADVPLGAFLSGGVDSSTIAALMQAQSATQVRTFAIGFREKEYNEAPHAKAVAEHLGTEHTEFYVDGKQARDLIPNLPEIYDEPFADSSALPTLLVSQMARQQVSVALSGDAGDELFCGYRRYTDARDFWRKVQAIPKPLRKISAETIQALPVGPLNALGRVAGIALLGDKLKKGAPLLASTNQGDLYRHLLRAWPGKNPVLARPNEDQADWTRQEKIVPGFAPMERFMLSDMANYLTDDILTKVDRASMAVSLETRVPLLDHRVVEFAWRLPLGWKLREENEQITAKWVLRQVLYKHVPPEIINRPKMGFAVPLADWLRGDLRDWAEDLLDERRLRADGFFDARQIRQLWSQHLSGQRNWQAQLWAVLMFQAWQNRWNTGQNETVRTMMMAR
jgi:asparagine synthase (glutamine-hydrolysing)